MVGQSISHYKITEKLGEGGMGVVYKAQDTKLKRTVALKFLSESKVGDREQRARFIEEARAAAALDHPSICTVYEVGEFEGQAYIAMAFVDGEPLSELIRSGSLSVDRTLDLAIQIAEGLQEAHDKDIVHRDIKAANIMVTHKGQAKILDFGIAKYLSATETGPSRLVLGTPAYMSPEQTTQERVDQRTDVWSLGVVLYEMLAGEPPFRGEYEAAVVYSILHEDPPPLGEKAKDLPEGLENIVGKALQKKPRDRYGTAAEIAADLRAVRARIIASERTTQQLAPPRVDSPGRMRWKWLAAAAAVVLAGVLVWNVRIVEPTDGQPDAAVSTSQLQRISIAVLPLTNLSRQQDEDYFAAGMSEELTTTLAKIDGLRVISSSSTQRYRDGDVPVPQIGKELGVSYLVEGSVLRAGQRVRINAQLIDAQGGDLIWTRSYERDMRDILALQSEVARSIATQIQVKLTPTEELRLSRANPVDLHAYEDYLRGRFFTNQRTREGLEKALEHYRMVLDKDARSALAHAGMAATYLLQANHGYVPPQEVWPKAKAEAEAAIRLDPSLAEAHSTLGLILSTFEWKWAAAEKSYLRALELYPGDPTTNHRYAVYLSRIGRHSEAVEAIRRAHELDPLSLTINNAVAVILYMARKYDEAVEELNRNLELSETYYRTYFNLGRCYSQMSRHEEAIAALEKARQLFSDDVPYMDAVLGFARARAGHTERARRIITELSQQAKSQYVSPAGMALVCLGIPDADEAFAWLDEALAERAAMLTWVKVDPAFDPIRSDPRFDELVAKVGFE